ncbi:C40 family peptidase [Oryzomicrobium sp.]|uniref:C40 family peptidase n=1 Tax=Oryzomicrobium sp. TaxID=1911578 RepID=UPI0025CFF75E|nr:C40 family peptidase [Oryzomicrobium sp.]MCE1242891.1 C40 family peptidase [Oryzomicrobium sp.]
MALDPVCRAFRAVWRLSALLAALGLAACGTPGPRPVEASRSTIAHPSREVSPLAQEVVFYALGLLDTGYRFGGKNPEAGLDCSGMVSYIYDRAAGLRLMGSAADLAQRGRPVGGSDLRPGDLVFFNTLNRPYSHVGIYIGDNRFVHAPNSRGKIRVDRLDARYYAERFEAARTMFD